jgi:hypothetical protein
LFLPLAKRIRGRSRGGSYGKQSSSSSNPKAKDDDEDEHEKNENRIPVSGSDRVLFVVVIK